MSLQIFLALLMVVSVFTSLVVEAWKKFLGDKNKFSSNVLVGVTAIILSACVGAFYCIMAEVAFNSQIVIILIALVFLSWLCAMVGYDKVVQAITQLKFNQSEKLQ